MYFWKIDEESIYCLINASEIRDMGYDIKELSGSHDLMGRFLEEIVRDSFKYISWNADNGIQTYVARALPAGQFLLTISCTFIDVAIDRDLDQIRSMTDAIKEKITDERIEEIYSLTGEDKEKAFESLARDLHAICSGEDSGQGEAGLAGPGDENGVQEEYSAGAVPQTGSRTGEYQLGRPEGEEASALGKRKTAAEQEDRGTDPGSGRPGRKGSGRTALAEPGIYIFRYHSLKDMTAFCAGLGRKFQVPSVLYRCGEDYVLEVAFPSAMRKDEVLYCVMAGEEYGAKVKIDKYESNYLKEHGIMVIGQDAIRILQSLQ